MIRNGSSPVLRLSLCCIKYCDILHDAPKYPLLESLGTQVLVFSPTMPVGHPVVTLEEFAAFPQLELLSLMLQPSRGWEAGWRCEFSPALQGRSPHFPPAGLFLQCSQPDVYTFLM